MRQYTHHFDFISDFMWLDDKKQLVATRCVMCAQIVHVSPYAPLSGDGSLSVMDVRSKKVEPFAQSEDQEDELLSILPIKGYTLQPLASSDHPLTYAPHSGQKVVIGTQLGILSIFNRKSGWGDCVDRIPG